MEELSQKIARQARFAEYIASQPEWNELLNEVRDNVVGEWMRGETTEIRELAYAKIKALGLTHALVMKWQDRQLSQDIMAEQAKGTSAP